MATQPKEQEDTAFEDAFASFANPEPVTAADPDPAPAADPDPAPAADPDPTPTPTPAPAADPDPDPTPAPAADPDPDPAPADAQTDALIARLAGLVKDVPAPVPTPAPAATPPAAQDELYDAAEKEFLVKYDEDWGDVARGEGLKRRAEYRQLIG